MLSIVMAIVSRLMEQRLAGITAASQKAEIRGFIFRGVSPCFASADNG
jgi:hypothetical protein